MNVVAGQPSGGAGRRAGETVRAGEHASPGGAGSHAGRVEHAQAGVRTYLVVAAFLLVLTAMEVVVFYIPALRGVLVPVLVVLALSKFALVAMFYMHLRFDSAWFAYLLVFPLVIATGLAVYLMWLFHRFGTTGIRP
jgi:cytochrome c oxidase subunit IV